MMKGLFIKDLYLLKNQKYFFFITFFMCIGALFVNFNPVFVISYSTFMISVSTLSSLSYDEFDNGYTFLFTLPVSRKNYVTEKYLFSLIIGGGTWITVTMIMLLVKTVKHQTGSEELVLTVFLLLLLALMFLALALPLQLKFGAEKGRIAFLTVSGVICLAIFGVVKSMRYWKVDKEMVLQLITMNSMSLIGILTIICILAVGISYLIAVKIMEKKQF